MNFPELHLRLPAWLERMVAGPQPSYPSREARMRLVIELSRQSVAHGTGGPFGAGIFDQSSGRLYAPGVNLVLSTQASLAHAEMVAITIAQLRAGNFDLNAPGLPPLELVTSTEPCAMCLGALPWSGLRTLVCGARDADARGAGFDEGAKPADWQGELEARGIAVARDVCRDEAAAVLRDYAQAGGPIYNPRLQ